MWPTQEQNAVTVNSSQVCLTEQSTRHTILGYAELTAWRVDWHPFHLRVVLWGFSHIVIY